MFFVHFDFDICYAPQRRPLFWHLNFQKCSGTEVFSAFWLGHVLRATTACTFSTSQLQKVLRTWCALCILTFIFGYAPQRRPLFRHLNFQKCSDTEVFSAFWLGHVLRATTACTFSTSQLQKMLRTWCALCILTSIFATRHSGVHYFDISTSKSAPALRCFLHFDLEMCFVPQQRALFRHLNFKKCFEPGVLCAFWLRYLLRATAASTISTSQLPKVLRHWGVFCILTWKCASCHNSVHFFDISTSKSVSNLVCFVHFDFDICYAPTAASTISTSQLPKVLRHWGVFCILTWKCASCHNSVHFFDISTSKSASNLVCFVHFDFDICYAPQRRPLFRHLNFQKCSDTEVFSAFWPGNVLRATTACTFSTSQLQKVLRTWCALCILTSIFATRHNGVHYFDISTSKSAPTLRCFLHFDLDMCFVPQQRALFRHLNFSKKCFEPGVLCAFWLRYLLRATAASTISTSQLPNVLRHWGVFCILTWKCASCHNSVHFFDISTSKSASNLVCFVHFDFDICYAPQRRPLFRHLNFQKCSDTEVFSAFWLGHVLRATTACTFPTSQLQKVLRTWCALCILISIFATCHSGIHYFDISTSKSAPTLRCFLHFDLDMCFVPQQRAHFRHLSFKKCFEPGVLCAFWLLYLLRATAASTISTSQLPKVLRHWGVFCILTWKCASCHNSVHFFDISASKVLRTWCALCILTSIFATRHSGVHYFDISTSKSAPTLRCFLHFDLEMCFVPQPRALFRHLNFKKCFEPGVLCGGDFDFDICYAPQRRPLFRHLNFQKCSDTEVFSAFWPGKMVLRATTACTFSTSQLQKVLRTWCALLRYLLRATAASTISTSQLPKVLRHWGVFCILTWKCASCHNSVHFFDISASKSASNLVCFVHFDFDIGYAPQRRPLFRHLNFQKCSDTGGCFLHFDLEMCFVPQRRALFHFSFG